MFRPKSTLRSLVLLAGALCVAQSASSGPPASAKEAEFRRFVFSGSVQGAATLDVLVEDDVGQPLDGGLYELKDGVFESTLSYPIGVAARLHVKALDRKGELIAENSVLASFDGTNAGASVVSLEPRDGGPLGTVVVSPWSLKVAPLDSDEPGLLRYELRAQDVDGRVVEIPTENVSWSVTYPEKTDWSPCKSGANCIEFRLPLIDKSTSRPEVVACVRNQTCLVGATVIDPSRVAGYSAISAGHEHACALTRDSRIFCWGRNQNQELGRVTSELCRFPSPGLTSLFACGPTPHEINCPAGSSCRYKALDAGLNHTCAVDLAGAIWCWGMNDMGQLGFACAQVTDPDCLATATPRKVIIPGPRGFTQPTFWSVSAGEAHTCAVSTVGSVFCWGENSSQQLGSPGGREPRVVPSSSRYLWVSTGSLQTCAVTSAGDLDCWGTNLGNVIVPTFRSDVIPPSSVRANHPGLVGRVTRVAAGRFGTCAHSDGGGIVCWGDTITGTDHPVSAASVVADLELGASAPLLLSTDNVCAISSDLVLCGARLGSVAQVAGSTSGFFDTTVGGRFECGVKSGGEAFCWGDHNEFGQLGDGGTTFHKTPGRVLGP